MAYYDNKHWLLSHIRNSFISSDDTGISEMVMAGEVVPRKISAVSKHECYPEYEESDDEFDEPDFMGQSFDIQSDLDFGAHRQRSNTAQRLEKMDQERKKAAKTKHIKWEMNPVALTSEEMAQLFERNSVKKKTPKKNDTEKKHSLLTEQIEKSPLLPQNPFMEFAKFDGQSQVGAATRKYCIFLTMLPPAQRNYPMIVVVLAAAKVQDLIGLICWKFTLEHQDDSVKFKDSVNYYRLYIAEDDGEVVWDFPCLDPNETVGKFGFGFLALVELKELQLPGTSSPNKVEVEEITPDEEDEDLKTKDLQEVEDMQKMRGHMTAMEALLYQSYRVYIIHKVRTKTEIHLGISGDKVEIDPIMQQKVSAKFWNRQKAVTYDMDNVAACDLTETSKAGRATLRLVYHSPNTASGGSGIGGGGGGGGGTIETSNLPSFHTSTAVAAASSATGTFKHHDFEADHRTADEIVQKLNHILDLRSSQRRREYLALRERKSHRRKSFHLGPR